LRGVAVGALAESVGVREGIAVGVKVGGSVGAERVGVRVGASRVALAAMVAALWVEAALASNTVGSVSSFCWQAVASRKMPAQRIRRDRGIVAPFVRTIVVDSTPL
jgi:hypothetical protein